MQQLAADLDRADGPIGTIIGAGDGRKSKLGEDITFRMMELMGWIDPETRQVYPKDKLNEMIEDDPQGG